MEKRAERENQIVLIVDDSQVIHLLVGVCLRPEGVEVMHAYSAEAALELSKKYLPDLFLLDLQLPGMNGLEFLHLIKEDAELKAIPAIMLTSDGDITTKVQAFNAGVVDYITKPFDSTELRARVSAGLRTKRYQDLLSTRAQLDGLTGLWNRTYFDQRLADEVAVSSRHGRAVSLIMLDIDHFKKLNDNYGHPFGDLVLRRVAQQLDSGIRQTEIACRYGGEEFGIILRETDLDGAKIAGERIRAQIEALAMIHDTHPVPVTASLGISSNESLADPEKFTPADLIISADKALYQAKQSGRNRVVTALDSVRH